MRATAARSMTPPTDVRATRTTWPSNVLPIPTRKSTAASNTVLNVWIEVAVLGGDREGAVGLDPQRRRGPGRDASPCPTWPPVARPRRHDRHHGQQHGLQHGEPGCTSPVACDTSAPRTHVHHDREEHGRDRVDASWGSGGTRPGPSNGSTRLPFVMPEYPSRTKPRWSSVASLSSSGWNGRGSPRRRWRGGPRRRAPRTEARPRSSILVVRADAQRPPEPAVRAPGGVREPVDDAVMACTSRSDRCLPPEARRKPRRRSSATCVVQTMVAPGQTAATRPRRPVPVRRPAGARAPASCSGNPDHPRSPRVEPRASREHLTRCPCATQSFAPIPEVSANRPAPTRRPRGTSPWPGAIVTPGDRSRGRGRPPPSCSAAARDPRASSAA